MSSLLETAPELDVDALLHHSGVVYHRLYQCPLHLWLAEGRHCKPQGDGQPCYWLYVEYRNRRGECRYSQFRFASTEEAAGFILEALPLESLHEIDPERTLRQPVSPARQMTIGSK